MYAFEYMYDGLWRDLSLRAIRCSPCHPPTPTITLPLPPYHKAQRMTASVSLLPLLEEMAKLKLDGSQIAGTSAHGTTSTGADAFRNRSDFADQLAQNEQIMHS